MTRNVISVTIFATRVILSTRGGGVVWHQMHHVIGHMVTWGQVPGLMGGVGPGPTPRVPGYLVLPPHQTRHLPPCDHVTYHMMHLMSHHPSTRVGTWSHPPSDQAPSLHPNNGQWAGDTHPTGMHSCVNIFLCLQMCRICVDICSVCTIWITFQLSVNLNLHVPPLSGWTSTNQWDQWPVKWGKVTGCYAGHIHHQRCCTTGES